MELIEIDQNLINKTFQMNVHYIDTIFFNHKKSMENPNVEYA